MDMAHHSCLVFCRNEKYSTKDFEGLQTIGSLFRFGTPLYYLEPLVNSKQLCHYSISSPSALLQETIILNVNVSVNFTIDYLPLYCCLLDILELLFAYAI